MVVDDDMEDEQNGRNGSKNNRRDKTVHTKNDHVRGIKALSEIEGISSSALALSLQLFQQKGKEQLSKMNKVAAAEKVDGSSEGGDGDEDLIEGQNCDTFQEEREGGEDMRKCSWCQRPGLCPLVESSGGIAGGGKCKAFCSERCFSQYRRAAFKKNRRCDWCHRPGKQPLNLVKDELNRQFCR